MDQARIDKLKTALDDVHQWPSIYTFKFIVPATEAKLIQLQEVFPDEDLSNRRLSKNGKYVSITISKIIFHSDEVIEKHRKASLIEELLSL